MRRRGRPVILVVLPLLLLIACSPSGQRHSSVSFAYSSGQGPLPAPSGCVLTASTQATQIELDLRSGTSAAEEERQLKGARQTDPRELKAEVAVVKDLGILAAARKLGIRTSQLEPKVVNASIDRACG